jgi:hypothetical protein
MSQTPYPAPEEGRPAEETIGSPEEAIHAFEDLDTREDEPQDTAEDFWAGRTLAMRRSARMAA